MLVCICNVCMRVSVVCACVYASMYACKILQALADDFEELAQVCMCNVCMHVSVCMCMCAHLHDYMHASA